MDVVCMALFQPRKIQKGIRLGMCQFAFSNSKRSLSGGTPYPNVDGTKIIKSLQEGYRMPKPQHVDDDLYETLILL